MHIDVVPSPSLRALLATAFGLCLANMPAAAQRSTDRGPSRDTVAAASPTALKQDPSVTVAFSGEVRSRSEWTGATTRAPADAVTALRSRIGLQLDAARHTRLVLQLQDSRVLGTEGSTAPAALASNALDLHQAYLQLTTSGGPLETTLRVGRQEIAVGNERLVGAANWTSTARSFDGARVRVAPRRSDRWSATAFVATVEERGVRFGAASVDHDDHDDHVTAGAYATLAVSPRLTADVTFLTDHGSWYRAFDRSNRTTIAGRIVAVPVRALPVRAEVESAYQSGSQRVVATGAMQDVYAWLAALRVGTTPLTARRLTLGVGADILSGDATPTDGRYSTFATMFATNHGFYGLSDMIGEPAATTRERGLDDIFVTAGASLGRVTTVRSEWHRYSMRAGSDRALGCEGDVVFATRLNGTASLELGAAVFRAGSGAAAVGFVTRSTQPWIYAQVGVAF